MYTSNHYTVRLPKHLIPDPSTVVTVPSVTHTDIASAVAAAVASVAATVPEPASSAPVSSTPAVSASVQLLTKPRLDNCGWIWDEMLWQLYCVMVACVHKSPTTIHSTL